jgi:hypothetical protein
MTAGWRIAAICGAAMLAAGCASVTEGTQARTASVEVPLSLNTAQTSADGTWAVIPMGATGPNLFWQMFELSAAGTWSLQTPPDIATNGAIVLAPRKGTLVTGIRASLDLTFSPVTETADDGKTWTTLAPDSGLADVPDALAAAPDGHLMALGAGGQVSVLNPGGSSWTALTSQHALASEPGTRDCGLTALTAAAYTTSGTPLLAGTCSRAGVAGIFAYTAGTWHLTGPVPPPALTTERVQVLRLIRTGIGTEAALLEAGSGIFAAWSSDNGRHWSESAAFALGRTQPVSVSFGAGGGIVMALTGNHAETLASSGASWQSLPALPAGRSITLAETATGATDALAADGSTLTVWQHTAGSDHWVKTQAINVPIQYGSSS